MHQRGEPANGALQNPNSQRQSSHERQVEPGIMRRPNTATRQRAELLLILRAQTERIVQRQIERAQRRFGTATEILAALRFAAHPPGGPMNTTPATPMATSSSFHRTYRPERSARAVQTRKTMPAAITPERVKVNTEEANTTSHAATIHHGRMRFSSTSPHTIGKPSAITPAVAFACPHMPLGRKAASPPPVIQIFAHRADANPS